MPFLIRLSRTGNYTPTAAAAAEALAVDDGSFALLRNAVNGAVAGDDTLLIQIPDLAKRALLPFGTVKEVRLPAGTPFSRNSTAASSRFRSQGCRMPRMAASARRQDAQVGTSGTRDTTPGSGPPLIEHPCADSIEWAAHSAGAWRVIRSRWKPGIVLHVTLIREGGSRREAIDFMRQGIGPEDPFLVRRVVEGPDGWHSEGASEIVDEAHVARTCNVASLAEIGQSAGDDLPLWLRRDLAGALP